MSMPAEKTISIVHLVDYLLPGRAGSFICIERGFFLHNFVFTKG